MSDYNNHIDSSIMYVVYLPVSHVHGFGLSAGRPPGAGDELFLKIADLHPSNVLFIKQTPVRTSRKHSQN